MILTLKTIARCGILTCLLYMEWYKWVFGEKAIILYAAAGIAVACMTIDLINTHKEKVFSFPYGCINNVVMCGYAIFTGFFIAISKNVLMEETKTLFANSMTCLALCYAASDGDMDWLMKGIIGIAMICSLWSLLLGYNLPGYGMVLGPTNNPHTLGMAMDLGIFALAYRTKQNSLSSFVFHLLAATLFLYTIIQCGSRKCIIGAVIVMTPWLYITFRQIYSNGSSNDRKIIVLSYLVLISVIIYLYIHEFVGSSGYERLANMEESAANQKRIHYYQMGFEFFEESPIFGIGLGQFAVRNPYGTYSHSTIAEAFASWGLAGGLLYFIPLISAAYRAIKLAFQNGNNKTVIISGLCMMELFLSFVQIFFYSLTHMIAWTIIFSFIHMSYRTETQVIRRCKYVKA